MAEKCKRIACCDREAGHLGPCLDFYALKGIKEGVAAMKEGRVKPWEDVERELWPGEAGKTNEELGR